MNILITGGSSGIGAAMVKCLSELHKHHIYFTYARSQDAAKAMETVANVKAIHCDFTDNESVEHLLSLIPSLDIDVLINNANTGVHKEHFHKTAHDIFSKSFEWNIMPVLRITQEVIKCFRKKRFGKIINIISSVVVNKPPTGWAEYTANKSYLLSMSRSWAVENIKFNITSNSISPSFVLTNIHADMDERIIEQMIEDHPLKKLLTAEEVADAALYYVNASQQVNGTNLVMNAGSDIA